MKTAKEFIDEVFHTQKMMPYTEKCVTEIIHKFAAQQVALERERIKKIIESETEWPSDELIKLIDRL